MKLNFQTEPEIDQKWPRDCWNRNCYFRLVSENCVQQFLYIMTDVVYMSVLGIPTAAWVFQLRLLGYGKSECTDDSTRERLYHIFL